MTAKQSTHDVIATGLHVASTSSLILVVDPNPDTREMYVAGLALSGWIADGVTDGREALAKAISCRPAAIVTETRVPRLDGVELCRLLRRDPDTQHIPILVVTSDADERRIAAAEAAGADRVLLKPCLPDELVRAIDAILSIGRDPQSRRVLTARGAASTSVPGARPQSRRFQRFESTTPPSPVPELSCPRCDQRLIYLRSHIGGVSARYSEQWDDYECRSGCGQFQYRHRTRKLRDVS